MNMGHKGTILFQGPTGAVQWPFISTTSDGTENIGHNWLLPNYGSLQIRWRGMRKAREHGEGTVI